MVRREFVRGARREDLKSPVDSGGLLTVKSSDEVLAQCVCLPVSNGFWTSFLFLLMNGETECPCMMASAPIRSLFAAPYPDVINIPRPIMLDVDKVRRRSGTV